MPTLVFLWTDVLLWLIVALGLVFAWAASRHEHLREPWRRVLRSPVGVGTGLVLAVFICIGLLDSVHFRGGAASPAEGANGQVLSLFDHLAGPLRVNQEKTYSAPLSTRQFTKENLDTGEGGQVRDYPRLKYGGAHLEDPARDQSGDMAATVAGGLVRAALVWSLMVILLGLREARRRGQALRGSLRAMFAAGQDFPWRTLLFVSAALLGLGFVAAQVGTQYHLLGTDKVGEDVFYQALKSIRTGLVIGTLTTLVMLPAALFLGVAAGYFRGWVDDVIQYLYTTLNSIPGVLLIAAAVLMMQVYMDTHADAFRTVVERADMQLLFLCLILGVTSWTSLCRLLRGEALKLRELDYVQAAHAFGVGHLTVLGRHVLPNVMHIVIITLVLDFSGLVLAEAVLSYVGIGVDPTTYSWGNMINSARLELAREPVVWWSLAAALVFMFSLVLAANLFSDVVRDAFDPRLRGERS
ncbi:MAG: ABC transporter permease [Pseudomonadota bacterium]